MNIKLFKVVLLSLLLSITGCGYHLRGKVQLHQRLKILTLTPDSPFDPLHRKLTRRLKSNKTQVVLPSSDNDSIILNIVSQDFSEEVISYNRSGQANAVKLTYKVVYQLHDPKNHLGTAPITISQSSNLNFAANEVLNTEGERKIIKNELLTNLVTLLMLQLEAVGK